MKPVRIEVKSPDGRLIWSGALNPNGGALGIYITGDGVYLPELSPGEPFLGDVVIEVKR